MIEPPRLEMRPIDSLIPYARNARTHSADQIAQISASLQEFGWTNAVLADADGIVAGHGRVLGARKIYDAGGRLRFPNGAPIPDGMVPVVDVTGWTPAQRRAYILADNKLAMNAGWDDDLLRVEITDLKESAYDLSVVGFSDDELAELFNVEVLPPEKDPDATPDLPEAPHSVEGDIWVCGPHRIMCADSLSPTNWDRLLNGELADIAWTDPPYGVSYVGKTKDAMTIKNDNMEGAEFRDFLSEAFGCLFTVMKPGASIYVAHADTEGYNFRGAFQDAGFKLSGCLIWKKNSMVLGRSPYQWIHEPILYGWRPGAAHRFYGGRKQVTVADFGAPFVQREDGTWSVDVGGQVLVVSGDAKVEGMEGSVVYWDRPTRSDKHPTTKPTGLILKQLRNSARPKDIVVDAFGGSGSTMIAAEQAGMCARLMELDPRFVDVQAQRYFEFTGRVPVHAETGAEFPVERPAT